LNIVIKMQDLLPCSSVYLRQLPDVLKRKRVYKIVQDISIHVFDAAAKGETKIVFKIPYSFLVQEMAEKTPATVEDIIQECMIQFIDCEVIQVKTEIQQDWKYIETAIQIDWTEK